MNTLIKVFIVINLVLSALFCAFSLVLFANRQDWKQMHQDVTDELNEKSQAWATKESEMKEQIANKTTEADNLNSEIADVKGKLGTARTTLEKLNSKLANLEQEYEEVKSKKATTEDRLEKATQELTNTKDELEKTLEIAQTASSDLVDLKEQIVYLEKERSGLKADIEISKSKRMELEEKLKELEWTIAKIERHGIDVKAIVAKQGEPESPIHAKVLAVRGDVNIVLLSVGKKDKVKEGYRLTIYNGGVYKGKVQVESVYPDMSSARILTSLSAPEQSIEEGDNASTRVY